jgi:hypothetical protein
MEKKILEEGKGDEIEREKKTLMRLLSEINTETRKNHAFLINVNPPFSRPIAATTTRKSDP